MRVLIYSYNYHPEPNGIAPLMAELAESLADRGHDVRVVTAMPNYPQRQIYEGYRGKLYLTEEKNGVLVQRCYVKVKPNPGFLDRVAFELSFLATSVFKLFSAQRPDVIFLAIPPLPACLLAAVAAKIYGCGLVSNIQVLMSEAMSRVGSIGNRAVLPIFTALEAFNYRTSDRISVITEKFADYLVKGGVPPEKIACIPNWVDTDFIRPLPKSDNLFRQQLGWQNKFVVLYAGNIALTEGLETALAAADRLRNTPDIVFLIVGEEKAIGRLENEARSRQIDNITFLPFQPREKLPQLLAAADVGLVLQKRLVSMYNMPSKIPLWLASGRAIVASVPFSSPAARAVKESGGGIVIAPEDPDSLANTLFDLYARRDRTEQLGQQGRIFAERYYARQGAIDAYEALLQSLSLPRRSIVGNPE